MGLSEVDADRCLSECAIAGDHRNSSTITALLLTDEDTLGPLTETTETGDDVFYDARQRASPPQGEETGHGEPCPVSASAACRGGGAGGRIARIDNTTQERLEQVAEVLEVPEVKPGAAFRAVPLWGSLTALALAVMLEQRYGRPVAAGECAHWETVADLAAFAGVTA